MICLKKKPKNITDDQNIPVDHFPDHVQWTASQGGRLAQGAGRIRILGLGEQALAEASSPDTLPPKPDGLLQYRISLAWLNCFLWLQLTSATKYLHLWSMRCWHLVWILKKPLKIKVFATSLFWFSPHNTDLMFSLAGSLLMVSIPQVRTYAWNKSVLL